MKSFYIRRSLLLLVLFISSFSFAGTIKGKVTDAVTGEPLVGAVVKLTGTKYSTFVKLDGSFSMTNVPAGTYSISISYLGYNIKDRKVVLASDNETQAINFSEESTTNILSSVTVSTSNNKETDQGARRLEKIADPIINVLSTKTLQLLPDITVANAIQRVSGVTIEKSNSGEGRYPIIRGMEKRYINTLINGIKIPSPDNKNRFIPLDLFPSELLERLEVSKSLTPSMEGDAIGGTINLVMKDAPNKLIVQANGGLGYNASFQNDKYTKFSSSTMNKQSPAERFGATYQATYKDFPAGHLNYSTLNSPISSSLGLTVGNRFGKDKQFGFIIAGSFQNIYKGTTSNFFLPASQPGLDNIPLFSDLQLRKYSTQSKRTSATGKFDYHINKNNKISLSNTFVRLDDYQTRIVWDTVALNSLVDNWQRSQWIYQTINNTTLQGQHQISHNVKFDWSLVYSVANNHMPDQAQFIHEYPIVATSLSGDKLQSMSRIWLHNSDKDYSAYLNMTKNYSRSFELKFGGLIRSKTRDNFYNSYSLKPQLNSLYTNINDAVFQFSTPADGTPSPNGNNYTFSENITSGYVQGKWQVFNKLEAIGGFRYEDTYQQYETKLTPDVAARSGTIKYHDLLPSVLLKYALSKNQNLRLSYYKALARPGFAEMIPDGPDGEFFKEIGNPQKLNHTTADNLDFRYEYYSGSADQILLGVFYKNIQNPIEIAAVKPAAVNNLYLEPINNGQAINYGFEAVFTKYFGPFGISANYTYTQSSITNDSLLLSYRGSNGSSLLKYVSDTRPLQGQSNNVGNLAFIYKNPKIGFDIQVALVYTGERIVFVSPYYGLNYWQSPTTQLDISFEKRIAKNFSFYGKINNLTNTPYELSLHQSYNAYLASSGSRALSLQSDPSNRIIVQQDYYNISYLFGLRYKL